MADEKRIRVSISGDASELGKEVKRVQSDVHQAFEDLGLTDILSQAEKQFDKIEDRIKGIGDALKEQRGKANSEFDTRASKATNEYGKNKVERERGDYSKKEAEAWDKWSKLATVFEKAMKDGKIDENGNLIPPGGGGGKGGGALTPSGKASGKPGLLARIGGKLGSGNVSGAAAEGGSGLMSAAGLGAGAATVLGGLAIGIGVLIAKSVKDGLEEIRVQNKLSAKIGLDYDSFGNKIGIEKQGYSTKEFKEFALSQLSTMQTWSMGQGGVEDAVKQRLYMKTGYGLEDGQVSAFDKFKQQDVRGSESSRLIADILSKSEKRGILGVSGADFSLLPQKIEQVANLMSIQKGNSEKIDSNSAMNLMMAGNQIGGRFGDDRAGDAFGRIDSSIKNPGSPGMKAYIFEMLRKNNPNASYTRLLGQMEGGASGENLQAILPQINKMPQGEYRTMMLYQLTKNWQDAIRLDNTGGAGVMLQNLKNKPMSDKEAAEQFGKAQGRGEELTDVFKRVGSEISSTFSSVGRDIVGAVEALTSDKTQIVGWMPGAGGMMTPIVVPKGKPNVVKKTK